MYHLEELIPKIERAVDMMDQTVEEEAEKKKTKYSHLEFSHHFVPVAVETLGVFGPETRCFLWELGRRLKEATLEPLSHHFLLQRISVAVQRGNTAAILGSIASDTDFPFLPTWLFLMFLLHFIIYFIIYLFN